MAALTKNAISVTVRNKNKKYFQKFKILEKNIKKGWLEQNFLLGKKIKDRAKRTEIKDHKGYNM